MAMGMSLLAGTLPAQEIDEHAQHRAAAASASAAQIQVSTHSYPIPDVVLRDSDGQPVALRTLLAPPAPVVMNFIYTSCTTICPVMTASLLQLQGRLAKTAARPRYVSISIDPDFDTSGILKGYAKRNGADWLFLTGSRADVLRVLNSFESWRGSKANHAAVTLMRPGQAAQWTRIEGLASAQKLETVWRELGS
jgi:protein SCO1/2